MRKFITAFFIAIICLSLQIHAQIPTKTLVQIVKAEDELRYDKTLEDLMRSPNAKIRARAALAAGRIGNDAAIPALANLLETDKTAEVRTFAAFAVGEIESIKGADAILKVLANLKDSARARAIEAAGKIVAANPKETKSKDLGEAILNNLKFEKRRRSKPDDEVILLGLTAVLRARPEKGENVVAEFLNYSNERIRADAANTLTRIRAKNANETLRKMLVNDSSPIARANAARALGAAEDKDALDILMKAAVSDADSRVRVSAIRAVGSLKDTKVSEKLIQRGENLFADYKKSKFANPTEKNEILEIATVLGRLLPNSNDEKAVQFLDNFRQADKFVSPETEIALARIAPKKYVESVIDAPENAFGEDWRTSSAAFQGLAEIANLEANDANNAIKAQVRLLLVQLIGAWITSDEENKSPNNAALAVPDLLRTFAAFKSENTSNILRPILEIEKDVFIRAAIAEILGDQPFSKENFDALEKAFRESLKTDTIYNDAQLAILDALFKLNKTASVPTLTFAMGAPDYLVRKKALDFFNNSDLQKELPVVKDSVKNAIAAKQNQVLPYDAKSGTKLGQVLNTNADYLRAVSRKNGTVKAVFTTEKGVFTIDLTPEDAPLTVDNFIKLANANYFNGLAVHRVVPNFVMQDGDPRGDGNGGPGWSIRCEINMLPYERGAVGMALSGKDTGGSQWFVTHSPQPHLDGGYTVFGKVNETEMKIVDSIVRGDKILSVKIIEKEGNN